MNGLSLKMPAAIGKKIWDIDFPERPFVVTGYRIGRMMGEDIGEYAEAYEGQEDELRVQYENCEISSSMPVSSIGKHLFLTRKELMKAVSEI